jgi:hypothetical protein
VIIWKFLARYVWIILWCRWQPETAGR